MHRYPAGMDRDRIDTRELSYFVAVADELHFSRAADRLGISQPPLSRAIRQLELRIGVTLFERTSRRVALTPAGEVFLAEARRALAAVDRAVLQAQQVARRGPVRIATNPGTGSGLLHDLIAAHAREPGAAAVELIFARDQGAALRSGAADVALLCDSEELDGLETIEAATEEAVVLLPAAHRLAGCAAVTLAQLRDEDGFQAEPPVTSLDQLIDLVAIGQLVVVVGESAADRAGSAVTAVRVVDLPPTSLVLAWRAGPSTASVTAFVEAARATLAAASARRAVLTRV